MDTVRLILGDAPIEMAKLPARSVQAVITSPPYNVGKEYEAGKTTADYVSLLHRFIDGCAHVLDCGGWMIINTADVICGTPERENVNPVLPLFDSYAMSQGFTLYDRRIWHKDPAWMRCSWHSSTPKSIDEFEYIYVYRKLGIPSYLMEFTEFMRNVRENRGLTNQQIDALFGFNGMAGHWTTNASQAATPTLEQWERLKIQLHIESTPRIENIIRYSNQRLRSRLDEKEWSDWGSRGVWHIRSVQANNDHPAKFPLALPMRLMRLFTWSEDIVLDSFMGSGTTGVACVRTGRRFIGIEIDPGYFAIAQRRIAEAQLQPSLLPNHGFHLTAAQVGLWDAEDESGAAAGEP